MKFEHAGLVCAVSQFMGHWNGYVGVGKGSPLWEKPYHKSRTIGKHWLDGEDFRGSSIDLFVEACCDPLIGQPLVNAFNPHGGITFTGHFDCEAGVEDNVLWWIGFDSNHAGDSPDICTLEWATEETKRLAERIAEFSADPFNHVRVLGEV